MNMVKVKTAELVGAALDWAVAKAQGYSEGQDAYCDPAWMNGDKFIQTRSKYRPSTAWSQGGPLIEKYKVFPGRYDDECEGTTEATRFFCSYGSLLDMNAYFEGPTPLIAACRAIVASKLGAVVEVPGELVG